MFASSYALHSNGHGDDEGDVLAEADNAATLSSSSSFSEVSKALD